MKKCISNDRVRECEHGQRVGCLACHVKKLQKRLEKQHAENAKLKAELAEWEGIEGRCKRGHNKHAQKHPTRHSPKQCQHGYEFGHSAMCPGGSPSCEHGYTSGHSSTCPGGQ
jgi:hypothetical protein